MDANLLKFYLARGNSFGVNTAGEHEGYLAWILLSKREPIHRFFELFNEEDDLEQYKNQVDVRERPYQLWVAELNREIYDNDLMPENSDYKTNEMFFFADLEGVRLFLHERQIALDSLKWSSEIDFF